MIPESPTTEPTAAEPLSAPSPAELDEASVHRHDARNAALVAGIRARPIPPSCVDADGHLIPWDDPDYQARRAEYSRRLDEYHARLGPVPEDPPDTWERVVRGINANRAPDRQLFEDFD